MVTNEESLPWRVKAAVSRETAAEVLSVSVRHIDALVTHGDLASRQAGRRTLICVRSILEWSGEMGPAVEDPAITNEVSAILRRFNS